MSALSLVPELNAILADPALARSLPLDVALDYRCALAHVHAELVARIARLSVVRTPVVEDDDPPLTTEEAAAELQISVVTLRRRKDEAPYKTFMIPMGAARVYRWSKRRILAYLATAERARAGGRVPRIGRRTA